MSTIFTPWSRREEVAGSQHTASYSALCNTDRPGYRILRHAAHGFPKIELLPAVRHELAEPLVDWLVVHDLQVRITLVQEEEGDPLPLMNLVMRAMQEVRESLASQPREA